MQDKSWAVLGINSDKQVSLALWKPYPAPLQHPKVTSSCARGPPAWHSGLGRHVSALPGVAVFESLRTVYWATGLGSQVSPGLASTGTGAPKQRVPLL